MPMMEFTLQHGFKTLELNDLPLISPMLFSCPTPFKFPGSVTLALRGSYIFESTLSFGNSWIPVNVPNHVETRIPQLNTTCHFGEIFKTTVQMGKEEVGTVQFVED
jgi:hypothetical protein